MDVYRPANEKLYRFALMVDDGAGGRRQRVISTGTANRRVAQEILRKTILLSEYVENGMPLAAELRDWITSMSPKLRKRLDTLGLIPKDVSLQVTSITEYMEDYFADCRFKGHGEPYIMVKRRQLLYVFEKAGVRSLIDLKAGRVKSVLEHLKSEGKSNRTVNTFRSSLNAFANWLKEKDHLEKHDLNRLPKLNEMEDRRHPRRAATDEEICRLLRVVPEYRRDAYMTAVMTGLRLGELRKIEKWDVDLDKNTLRVRAEESKNHTEAILPLHDEMVAFFRGKIVLLGAADRIFETIPNNLTFQRGVKKAGIAYKDQDGRYFDFHALRSTFATRLLRHDISLSKAIRLTRHKSVKTLEVHYDMLGLSDAEEAMDQLLGLGFDANGDSDEPSQ